MSFPKVVTGEYAWIDPFGNRHTVSYRADENGYQILNMKKEVGVVKMDNANRKLKRRKIKKKVPVLRRKITAQSLDQERRRKLVRVVKRPRLVSVTQPAFGPALPPQQLLPVRRISAFHAVPNPTVTLRSEPQRIIGPLLNPAEVVESDPINEQQSFKQEEVEENSVQDQLPSFSHPLPVPAQPLPIASQSLPVAPQPLPVSPQPLPVAPQPLPIGPQTLPFAPFPSSPQLFLQDQPLLQPSLAVPSQSQEVRRDLFDSSSQEESQESSTSQEGPITSVSSSSPEQVFQPVPLPVPEPTAQSPFPVTLPATIPAHAQPLPVQPSVVPDPVPVLQPSQVSSAVQLSGLPVPAPQPLPLQVQPSFQRIQLSPSQLDFIQTNFPNVFTQQQAPTSDQLEVQDSAVATDNPMEQPSFHQQPQFVRVQPQFFSVGPDQFVQVQQVVPHTMMSGSPVLLSLVNHPAAAAPATPVPSVTSVKFKAPGVNYEY